MKKLLYTLIDCAELIAKREGNIQLDRINKRLDSNTEIATMIEEKTKAWTNLKNVKMSTKRRS